jgi:hypothetical protein
MDPGEAGEVAAYAEEAANKTIRSLRTGWDRKQNANNICLSQLEIDPGALCDERYAEHVLVQWDDCPLFFGRNSGRVDVRNKLTLASGQGCSDAAVYNATHSSQVDVLTEMHNGSRHEVHVSVDSSGKFHLEGPPPLELTSDVDVQVLGEDNDGELLYEVRVRGQYDTEWAEGAEGTTIYADGHTNVHLTRKNHDYDVEARGMVFPPDCCHPTDGDVDVSIVIDQIHYSNSVSFGPSCGDAVVDGNPVQLHPCTNP